jgi:hypothetical protein
MAYELLHGGSLVQAFEQCTALYNVVGQSDGRCAKAITRNIAVVGSATKTPAGGVFDDGKDVQPCSGEGPGIEEVGGEDRVWLAAQERGPALAVMLGYGIDAGVPVG